jgi:hypothetical protein
MASTRKKTLGRKIYEKYLSFKTVAIYLPFTKCSNYLQLKKDQDQGGKTQIHGSDLRITNRIRIF